MSHLLLTALNAWGHAALLSALQISLQVLLLTIALLLVDAWARHRVRAALRYGLWMLIVLRLLLPPGLLSPTSVAYWLGPRLTPPRVEPAPSAWQVTFSEPRPESSLPVAGIPFEASGPPPLTFPALLLLTWLGGAGVFAGWIWRGQRRVTKLLRSARPAPAELQALLRTAAQDVGLRHPPELRWSATPHSPALCGLWRPVIVVPATLQLSPAAWRTVFLHELIHLQRRDLWANALQVLTQLVWWWNPLVWWTHTRIRQLRETAVDEAVMLSTNPETSDYPATLVAMARHCLVRPALTLNFVGILESPSRLERRVRRLLEQPLPRTARLGWGGWMIVLLAAAGAVPMGFDPRTEAAASAPVTAPTNPANFTATEPRPAEATPTPTTPLHTRLYQLDPQLVATKLAGMLPEHPTAAEHPGLALRRVFRQKGVEFPVIVPDPPAQDPQRATENPTLSQQGANPALFYEDSGRLFVRHTPAALDRLNEILQPLVAPDPPGSAATSPSAPPALPAAPGTLVTRTYRLDAVALVRLLNEASNEPIPAGQDVVQTQFKRFLRRLGLNIPLSVPDGPALADFPAAFINTNTAILFVRASAADQARLERTLQRLNQQPAQITLECRFVEGGIDSVTRLNLDWETPKTTNGSPHPAAPQVRLTAAATAELIQQLEAFPDIEILSTPKVTTLSDRAAQIFVGDTKTVVIGQSNSAAGPVTLTQQIATGPSVELLVVSDPQQPTLMRVTASGQVVEFLGYEEAPNPKPLIRTNSAQGIARLRDGQTLVLQLPAITNTVQMVDRVPYLSDIPLVGRLFTSRSSGSVVRQRLVLVTPMLIDAAGNRIRDPEHKLFDPAILP